MTLHRDDSCDSVPPHSAAELTQPDEPGLYVPGMKSYRRAPTFLAFTGYEQVRSVAAVLPDTDDAARRVELIFPETGVCRGTGLADAPDAADEGGSCATAPKSPQPLSLLLNPIGG